MIYPEKSESWPVRMTGQIPSFIDVFCLACIDRDTNRYRCWGYYESTAETAAAWRSKFPGAGVFEVATVRVPVEGRDKAALDEAAKRAKVMLDRAVWKDQGAGFVAFRNKLAEDLRFWADEVAAGRRPDGLVVEHVDNREFEELVRRSRSVGIG